MALCRLRVRTPTPRKGEAVLHSQGAARAHRPRLLPAYDSPGRLERRTRSWCSTVSPASLPNPSADPVRVTSGRTVVVFNIAGNRYRLLTAIHYNMRKVFILRLLTHAEYTRETWKDEL